MEYIRALVNPAQFRRFDALEKSAFETLCESAVDGVPDAEAELGRRLYYGVGGFKANASEGIRRLESAESKNSSDAALTLAFIYTECKEAEKSKHYFERAAHLGSPIAQGILGYTYMRMGDTDFGLHLLTKAAKGRDIVSLVRLADYYNSLSVKEWNHHHTAKKYYFKAIYGCFPALDEKTKRRVFKFKNMARYELGLIYIIFDGEYDKGAQLIEESAQSGYKPAVKWLETVCEEARKLNLM